MDKPLPILHLPTFERKVAALRAGHSIGYLWYGNIDRSLTELNGRGTIWQESFVYGFLKSLPDSHRGMTSSAGYFDWASERTAQQLIAAGSHVLLNSPNHLLAYMARQGQS